MKKRVYISGKISDLSVRDYTLNFATAETYLMLFYDCELHEIVNPLNIIPLFGIKKWLFFMIADIWYLLWCSHIALQPNWSDSRGARIEKRIAKFMGKKVIKLWVEK